MEKIFIDAEEKYLGGVVVYGHSDNKLYADAAHRVPILNDEVVNLFNKGLLIIKDTDTTYKPVAMKKNSTVYDVTVLNGATATAAFKVFKSTEAKK